jgi:hypothetical protein
MTEDDQTEHSKDQDLRVLVEKYYTRKLSEVKVEWPLEDGHVFSFSASRRLSELEYKTLLKLLQLAKPAIIKSPIVAPKLDRE